MPITKPFSYLISFEGLDAVGKTTLATSLVTHLASTGLHVKLFPEFSDSPIGELLSDSIRKYNFVKLHPSVDAPLSETLILMADLSAKTETSPLTDYVAPIVVADRYSDSLIAYQVPRVLRTHPALTHREIRSLLEAWIETVYGTPNITYLIDTPLELVFERVQLRDGYSPTAEDKKFFEEVQSIFKSLASRDEERILVVDGTKDLPQVLALVIESVTKKLAEDGIVKP